MCVSLREQAMRRPRHRDVLELASEIKGIDPDSTSAEHETARDRWKAEIALPKAGVPWKGKRQRTPTL
jgi:hypothetical protein